MLACYTTDGTVAIFPVVFMFCNGLAADVFLKVWLILACLAIDYEEEQGGRDHSDQNACTEDDAYLLFFTHLVQLLLS